MPAQDPHDEHGEPGTAIPRTEPPENDPTVIIYESDPQPSFSVTPGEDELEEVLVVLPDEEDDDSPTQPIEEIGLLDQIPGAGPTECLPTDHIEEYVGELDDSPVESLPELEHVEDITALVDGAPVQLEAPTHRFQAPFPVATKRRFPWLTLAAAMLLAVAAFLYGPDLYERYLGTDPRGSVAGADPSPTTHVVTDPVTTDPGVGPGGIVPGGSEPDPAEVKRNREKFRVWIADALAQSLGEPPAPEAEAPTSQ